MRRKKDKKKNQPEVPANIQILRGHYDNLFEKHRAIISEFTLSRYSKDIRERILREFCAEVQELITLCNNDGSYEAKKIINLCKNLEGTLECVNAHPEKYAGMPVENILYEHKADENDLDGNAHENGTGHHESHHTHKHDYHHDSYDIENCKTEEPEHEHEHEHKHDEKAIGEIIQTVADALTAKDKELIEKIGLDKKEFSTHSAVEKFKRSPEYARLAHMMEQKSRSK